MTYQGIVYCPICLTRHVLTPKRTVRQKQKKHVLSSIRWVIGSWQDCLKRSFFPNTHTGRFFKVQGFTGHISELYKQLEKARDTKCSESVLRVLEHIRTHSVDFCRLLYWFVGVPLHRCGSCAIRGFSRRHGRCLCDAF